MIKNAIIESTMLGRESHGILTFYISIKSGSTCCSVGGYALDQYDRKTEKRVFSPKSMGVISEILNVVGVNSWEDLPGKYIRFESDGWGSTVTKIGNIMDDKWVDFEEFFK